MYRRILIPAVVGAVFSCLATAPGRAVPNFRTAAAARSWAQHAEHMGDYADAAQAYQIEASIRRRTGDPQGAEVERRKADRLTTNIVFAVPSADSDPPEHSAKWEPPQGCYIGVRDAFESEYWGKDTANCENFANRIDHPVAVALDYQVYGRPFQTAWAERERRRGRALQIAWEPEHIGDVQDDDYLNEWAEAAGHSKVAIFLRFGGEMNGKWTPWGRSPATYRRAFRTVAEVMRRHAPNVAMVWAPNSIPTTNLDEYYPGDDVVDWVGISLYIVRFYDDDLSRPAWQDSIESSIDPFYRKYAARKPLCLAECGVTRRSRVEGVDADAFAADRIEDLMEAIKIRYPRLKMACFFDRNNLDTAIEGRRLNDFSFPEGSLALTALQHELQDPYFLGHVKGHSCSPIAYSAVNSLPGGYTGEVAVSISTYCTEPWMQVERGDSSVKVARPFHFEVPPGDGPLHVTVFDDKGHIAKKVQLSAE